MSRTPVSVIVTASGLRRELGNCLESLRPSLGPDDEVVCVLPPGRADLRPELRGRTWLTRLDNGPPEQGARWAAGLTATSRPLVVLLDGDVVVPPGWLEPIVAAFDDPGVVAAGPRCYRSFGPQGMDLPDDARSSIRAFYTYAAAWARQHRDQCRDVDALGPVCVAVRRDALTLAGGPTLDLPYPELRAQGRIVLVESSLVAHSGTEACALRGDPEPPGPLLSAALIVRDEDDILAECLTSVRDFVDEIVVYDTGSTDRTREVAAEHGARVVAGYWNDHFGDARNRALAHCRGEWVLQIDADEVASGDPAKLRELLGASAVHAYLVPLESQQGHGGTTAAISMMYPRLFRRRRSIHVHRLHEQVADRITGGYCEGPPVEGLALTHSGYTVQRIAIKDKRARNLRLAELSTVDDTTDPVVLMNLGRTQFAAGRFAEAAATFERSLANQPGHRVRVSALKVLIEAYLRLGRLDAANEALEELRRISTRPVTTEQPEANIRLAEGNFAQTIAIARAFPESAVDDALAVVGRANLAEAEIKSLIQLNRPVEAAQRLMDCLRGGQLPLTMVRTADVLRAGGASLAQVAALVPRTSLRGLLFSAHDAPVSVTDEILDALWAQHGVEPAILAFAAEIGAELPLVRALDWSARLRHSGLAERCTLLALARNRARTPRDRALAAAIAIEMFADDHAVPLLAEALRDVPEGDAAHLLDEMRTLAPTVAANAELVGTPGG